VSTVRMPPILRQAVGGAREVDASGATVREVLADLTDRYPGIKGHLLDDGGELNRFVNVYVNNEDVRLGEGLETTVSDTSTVIVLPAMAGGAAQTIDSYLAWCPGWREPSLARTQGASIVVPIDATEDAARRRFAGTAASTDLSPSTSRGGQARGRYGSIV
jgi:sulfur-carrier protein